MLSCKKATYLASKKLDKKLTWREQIYLRMHNMICKICRRYADEIQKLHQAMNKAGESSTALLSDSVTLSKRSKERIKKAISQALSSKNH